MLVFNHVCHHYDNQEIFRNLSFVIDAPRVLITGGNGSGKTTLLLLAAGLLKPKAGQVQFKQQDVFQPKSKRLIGMSATKVALPEFMTVQDMLKFQAQQFAEATPVRAAVDWAAEFGLTPFLHTKVGDLSLGNYKKLSLIMALQHQPQLLLLDEPSNGLDAQAKTVLNRILESYPGQVIIASHEPLSTGDIPMQHLPLSSLITMDSRAAVSGSKTTAVTDTQLNGKVQDMAVPVGAQPTP